MDDLDAELLEVRYSALRVLVTRGLAFDPR
jgi:hypothetical protein